MKTQRLSTPLARPLPVILFTFLTLSASAATRYVWQESPSSAPPYTNWATAATNIQDAVDAAAPGDQVLVTNGVYATGGRAVVGTMTNRVAVTKPLTLQSVNGPQVTVIVGSKVPSIRCAYLTNGASLSGFTLTNGSTQLGESGGGVRCASAAAVVSDCILAGNSRGGASGGTLNNCVLTANSDGGAIGGTLNNCILTGNWQPGVFGDRPPAGGADSCTLNHCTLTGNYAGRGGGAYNSTLNNCTLTGNSAQTDGGGAYLSTLNNCTLTGNLVEFAVPSGSGAGSCTLNNCIVYFNPPAVGGADYHNSTLNYCCTTPMPGSGLGNVTNAPLFMGAGAGNLRLQSNSPCINAGNNAYVSGSTDLDGRPRIVGGTVDIGAYEFQGPGLSEFIGWLQQYGLPTDGSADYTDADQDGHNNWQEWKTWTIPTDAFSVLKLLTPQPETNGMLITWQSVSGQNYFLERATNAGTPFSVLQSNLVGQAVTTSFTDTNAVGTGTFLYRVGVPE